MHRCLELAKQGAGYVTNQWLALLVHEEKLSAKAIIINTAGLMQK
jgi:hypothetical protein